MLLIHLTADIAFLDFSMDPPKGLISSYVLMSVSRVQV